jgi:hypothetical protein
MKIHIAVVASLSLMVLACTKADETAATAGSNTLSPALAPDDLRMVSPALKRYRQDTLVADLWKRARE